MRSNELHVPHFSSSQFHRYAQAPEHFVAEASELEPFVLHRLYDDACDVGIAIRSERTGAVLRFYLEREERRDGDVLAWHFRGLTPHTQVTVTVFND